MFPGPPSFFALTGRRFTGPRPILGWIFGSIFGRPFGSGCRCGRFAALPGQLVGHVAEVKVGLNAVGLDYVS